MAWLSAREADTAIEELPSRNALFRAYALSLFAYDALLLPNFSPSADWARVIAPTEAGNRLLQDTASAGLQFAPELQLFTLFRLFYHCDLLIDHERTDLGAVLALLRDIHSSGNARWPYVFGNQLYHKFNDTYDGNRTDSLDADAALSLLGNTPQGVFQLGSLLSGPLGFVESAEERTLPPTLELPLWHCSDPGCQAQHAVRFHQYENNCTKACKAYLRYCLDHMGPASEWDTAILRINRPDKWRHGRPYGDLPAVIGDCIVGSERAKLCVRALQSAHNKCLTSVLRNAGRAIGGPDAVVSSLDTYEQHQLLLLLPDKDLIHLVDDLICRSNIRIPPSELRASKTYKPRRRRDGTSEISSLGIRSMGPPPLIQLSALVWNTYSTLDIANELEWRVRGHTGPTLRHSLMDFIRTHGPESAVRELILPSRNVTAAIGETLAFTVLANESEETTCSRLLWKLGFTKARYEDDYVRLRDRISAFRDQVLALSAQVSEDERARVRACGVNLFVSVEQFLEDFLCYNVWLMGSDHFTGTKFIYTKQDALHVVARILGEQIQSGEITLEWSVDGTNAIGTLVGYMQAFRAWVKERSSADKAAVERLRKDYPHYAEDPLWVFPFRHTELWADTSPEVMASYASLLDRIFSQIAQAELAVVRNGLDHKREDDTFPDADKMLACVTRLEQVIAMADNDRLVPKLFWGIRSDGDANGNVCDTFADYRGNTVSLWDPKPVLEGPKRVFGRPYLIAPFDLLHVPNSMLVFIPSPRTEYREYWRNYPRRRLIPPGADSRDESAQQD